MTFRLLSWVCGGDRGVEEMGHKAFKIRRSSTQQKRGHTDTRSFRERVNMSVLSPGCSGGMEPSTFTQVMYPSIMLGCFYF